MKKLLSLIGLSLILTAATFADIRVPNTPKPVESGKQMDMHIYVTKDVNEPTLMIRRSSIKQLRAALDEAEGIDDNTAAIEKDSRSISAQTVIGGSFLALAFIFGGVWFIRSKPSKTTVGITILFILIGSSAYAFANIAPPQILGITKNIFSDGMKGRAYVSGKVRVKVMANPFGGDFTLLVPAGEKPAAAGAGGEE